MNAAFLRALLVFALLLSLSIPSPSTPTPVQETVTVSSFTLPPLPQPEAGQAAYGLYVLDQAGQPVHGVMLQVCDETTCQVLTTDVNGAAVFTQSPYPWEIHVLKVPAGYTFDSEKTYVLNAEGAQLVIVLEQTE